MPSSSQLSSKSFGKFLLLGWFSILLGGAIFAGEQLAEDRQPQRELEDEDKAEAENLKQQIIAEKTRLAKFTDAVKKINDEIKEPAQKLNELRRGVVAITGIKDDFEGKDLPKHITAVNTAAKNVPDSGRLVAAVIEYMTEEVKKDSDPKKLAAIDKKIKDAEAALTNKYSSQVENLQSKKMEIDVNLRNEMGNVTAMRSRLLALYGYEVEGMGVVLFASEGGASGDAAVMRWIDNEVHYIELLSRLSYDDLASAYLSRVEKANNPYTGKPFPTSLKNYMGKAKAKLVQQKAIGSKKLDEKLTLMKEAIDDYERVLERLTPMTTAYYGASLDLIAAYFRMADDLSETAGLASLVLGSEFKPAPITAFAPPEKKAAPAKKGAKAVAKPVAKANAPVQVDAQFTGLSPLKLNDAAFAQAAKYYNDGMKSARVVYEMMTEVFLDLFDLYQDAVDEENKAEQARYIGLLEKFSPIKLRLQHSMEGAYAKWANLYPLNSPEHQKIIDEGATFIGDNLEDYRSIFPDDKQVYGYWMEILAAQAEPINPSKPLPTFIEIDPAEAKEMKKEELAEAKRDLERYPYQSDKIENIFNWYVVGDDKQRGKSDRRPAVQSMRVRALNNYAQARANLALNTFKRADLTNNAALNDRAKTLHEQAVVALAETVKNNSLVGETEPSSRYTAYAKIIIPYYLTLADLAIKKNDKAAAGEYAQAAMDAVLILIGAAEPNWKAQGSDNLILVQDFTKKNQLTVGGTDIEDMRLPLIISNAEKLYTAAADADRTGKSAEARVKFNEARDFYLLGLERARNLVDKSARDQFFPKALNNIAIASVKLKDYATAYVASQLLVQEFRNDFKDPLKNYPPEKFPNAKTYFANALNNLRASAVLRLRERGNEIDRRDYIDALLLCISYSNKNDDYVMLINAFKAMKQYAQAVRFVDGVAPDNDYYRLAQLMGAGVYLDLAKQETDEIKKITTELNPPLDDEGKPTAKIPEEPRKGELEKRLAELEKSVGECRVKAGEYAQKFVDLHNAAAEKWARDAASGGQISDYVKALQTQEKGELLKAQFIPILVAHISQDWDTVEKSLPAFLSKLAENKSSEAEEKQTFSENALWLGFDAKVKSVDYDVAEIAAGEQNLTAAANAADALAKVDKDNKFSATVATIFGSRWNKLADRARLANNNAAEKKYRLEAVNWLEKAEGNIYKQLGGAVSMISTLADQGLWTRAINVGDKVVNYWGDSLFTENSLFMPNKSGNDLSLTSAGNELSSLLKLNEVATAKSNNEQLLKKLNEVITKTVANAANADKYVKVLTDAANSADKTFKPVLVQAQEIASVIGGKQDERVENLFKQRPYLSKEISDENRYFLNRTLLEASYSGAIFNRPITHIIPPPILFYKNFNVQGYSSEAGRKKANLYMTIIDPNISASAAKAVFGADYPKSKDGGYVGEWKKALETTEDPASKAKLQRLINAVDTPIAVSLYGEPDPKRKGNLVKRNYLRARATINALLEYEKDHPTPDNNGKLLIADALNNLSKAVVFQNTLLIAKKSYAKAMVEDGKYNEALKYVEELCKAFPNDWSLSLELARVYSAMAQFESTKDGLKPRKYDNTSAAGYLRAIMQALAVIKFTPVGSESWWDAQLMVIRAQVASIKARKSADKKLQDEIPEVEISYNNPQTGMPTKQKITIKSMDKVGGDLAITLQRYIASVDPAPNEEVKNELITLAKNLEELGYKATLETATANKDEVDASDEPAAE